MMLGFVPKRNHPAIKKFVLSQVARLILRGMILWMLAFGLMAVLGLIGYYQGALRVGFSLIGLLVATLLALPLSGLVKPILSLFGMSHPVLISFVAPFVVFVVVLTIFKVAAFMVHRKLDQYYKYKGSDTQRSLFERMNSRVGICLGLANATFYLLLISAVAYFFGYFTFQISAADKDSFLMKQLNSMSQEMQSMGMQKAVAPLVPASKLYFDGADILGFVYHNPLAAQARLASYPAFLALSEKNDFKKLSDDVKFQQFWLGEHTFGELVSHEKIDPLFSSPELYTNVVGLLEGDFKDLKGYLETGSSAKYDEIKILGRWSCDFPQSFSRAKRNKGNMTLQELRRTRAVLGAMNDATLTAMINNQATLKLVSTNNPGGPRTFQGTWKDNGGSSYQVSLTDREKKMDFQATVESNKLLVEQQGLPLVFEK